MSRPTLSPAHLNRVYLQYLNKYPLLTKALACALFGALNEQLASLISGDLKFLSFKVGKRNVTIPHTFTSKVPLMAFYGFAVSAPLSHYGYKVLNELFGSGLNLPGRLLQILVSMATFTPVMSFLTVAFITFVANVDFNRLTKLLRERNFDALKVELLNLYNRIKSGLQKSLLPVIKSSWISSPIFMAFAQRFLEPNQWAIFFAFCYFVLGTYNNVTVKLAQGKKQSKKL
ncbi:DEKNAAC102511 [Brettanomyces naardenensis]|uniref:DEKNAAC102511 n=1 Tax=Brettanomyces naardenensis TaxID=13370 RepID=A0A448YKU4_BRENA|nr:DEKNAAC102511 [Brettanomyces naardenensis]